MKQFLLISILFILSIGFVSYKATHALFNDTAQSQNNTFSAAQTFHVVISEVQINGSNANQDFVELYNPTSSVVDLNGWQLQKKTSSGAISSLVLFGSSHIIPAHGYFLWANNKTPQNPFSTSIGADVSNGNNLSENNSIALEDASNNIIDQVGWGTGISQYVEGTLIDNGSDTNKSMERKAYSTSTDVTMEGGVDETKGNGYDTDDNSNDFILRTVSDPQNSSSGAEMP